MRPALVTSVLLTLLLGAVQPGGSEAVEGASRAARGTLLVVWGDPMRPEVGEVQTRFTLALPDGTSLPLDLQGQQALASNFAGQEVAITGRPIPLRGKSGLAVETISAIAGRSAAVRSVVGTKRVIFLLLKYADDASTPHPPAFYTDMTNPDTPPGGTPVPSTINAFFKKTSDNQFYWIGDVGGVGGVPATGWLTLPYGKSHYANCGWSSACADLNAVVNDGMDAGVAAGIDFSVYDNVNLVLNNDLDCCAWGGGLFYGGKYYGATWEPPWGQETGTYVHEMGHSLGLPHSGWVYFAYDSPWDMMSGRAGINSEYCGSYVSINSGGTNSLYCSEPGDGYSAPYRDYLGWIPSANVVVTDTSSTAVVTLEGAALPIGAATKMIKICIAGQPCTGNLAHYFTVEARVKGLGSASQFDNGIPGEGVIIHRFEADHAPVSGACFFNSQSGWAWPIDATPGDWVGAPTCGSPGPGWPDYALFNAQWLVGQTFVDGATGLEVKVQSRSGSQFTVTVNAAGYLFGDGFEGGSVALWSAAVGN